MIIYILARKDIYKGVKYSIELQSHKTNGIYQKELNASYTRTLDINTKYKYIIKITGSDRELQNILDMVYYM